MKIICNKNILQDALNLVGRAIAQRSTLQILECILISVDDTTLTLRGSDREISIDTAPMTIEVQQAGHVALDAKLFTEIIRKMPGDYVEIETDDKLITTCKSGFAKLKIPGLPGDEYPINDPNDIKPIGDDVYVLDSSKLRDIIKQTIFSVSLDPSKKVLNGELFQVVDSNLRVVAVDMYRISYRSIKLIESGKDISVIIPPKALNELSRILPQESGETIKFYLSEKKAIFETKQFTLVTSLLEGNFIRYDQIFNDDFSTVITCNRLAILDAFERSILIARGTELLTLDMNITAETVFISSGTERGQASEEVYCEIEGQELQIRINPKYLIEALRVISDETIALKFNTSLSPVVIRGIDENTTDYYKYLIVPLKNPK